VIKRLAVAIAAVMSRAAITAAQIPEFSRTP
jgi:hypothetical protein